MAITQTYRASVYSTTNAASYATSGTYTPSANSLLVAFVVGAGSNDDPNHATTPFSGHGVSWTKKSISNNALSTTHALSCWVADAGSSPTSAACTAQWATNRTGCAIIEYEITGADLTSGAAAALIQAVTNTGTGTSGTLSLSSESNASNRPLAFFVHLANEGTTPRTNWTETSGGDGNFNNPATGAAAQHRNDAFETTASATWSSSVNWRGIALEIAASIAQTLAPGVGALALAGLLVGVGFAGPAQGTLAFAGAAPTVSVGASGTNIEIPVGTLAIAGQTPTPAISGGTISVPAGALAFAGRAVGVGFAGPDKGAIAFTGLAPSLSIGSGSGTAIPIPVGSLTASGTYVEVHFKGPETGSLTLLGYVPEVFSGIKPMPTGDLVLLGRAMTLDTRVTFGLGSLTLLGRDPQAVVTAGGTTIVIPTGALAIPGLAPSASIAGSASPVVPAGTLSLTGRVPSITTSEGLISMTIGGIVFRPQTNSVSYVDTMNARNTLAFTLWDATQAYEPAIGAEVILYNFNGAVLFAGTIDNYEIERPKKINRTIDGYLIRVLVVDYNQIADRKLIAASFDDETFGNIVANLVANLAADGVIIGSVDEGPTFSRKVFNYRSLADCLNELSEDTGYSWWIDSQKAFHFRARESVQAPVDATEANVIEARKRKSRATYRNRQYIRAGRDITDPLTETFKGDNARQTFTVAFPFGEEPTVVLNGSPQSVGIRGVEDPNAFQWYWNKDTNEISQRSAGVPPTTADTIEVTYRGLFPVLVQAQFDDEIAARMTAEGGSGIYEAIEDYPDVDDADLALSTAVAKLQREGFIRETVVFDTDDDGIASGQLIDVTLPDYGVSGSYLVHSVRAKDLQGKFLRYTVTVLDGDAIGGWLAFYQKLVSKRRDSVERTNEQLQLLRSLPEVVACEETFSADDDFVRETRIGLAQIGRSEIGIT